MNDETDNLFYLGAGPLGAIVLGFSLMPLRGWTTASNFTFVFLALTIAVAEYGGRWTAVATALCSALSLDFFLTAPYMELAIADKHDIIAFVGLATCGLIAAALGARRGERIAAQTGMRKRQDLIQSTLRGWNSEAPIEPQLAKVLIATREVFPLGGAVVRDERNAVVASSAPADRLRPVPMSVLAPDTLLPLGTSGRELQHRMLPLPIKEGRLALGAGGRPLGWLDLWGNGAHASADSRQALSDVARLVATLLACGGQGARSLD